MPGLYLCPNSNLTLERFHLPLHLLVSCCYFIPCRFLSSPNHWFVFGGGCLLLAASSSAFHINKPSAMSNAAPSKVRIYKNYQNKIRLIFHFKIQFLTKEKNIFSTNLLRGNYSKIHFSELKTVTQMSFHCQKETSTCLSSRMRESCASSAQQAVTEDKIIK